MWHAQIPNGTLMFILHDWRERSEHSERKGIKEALKFCLSLYGWEGVLIFSLASRVAELLAIM